MNTASGTGFSMADPVNSFIATVTGVLTTPQAFFASLRSRLADVVSPSIFAVICFLVNAILSAILALLFNSGDRIGGFLRALIITPIFYIIALVISAAIIQLLVNVIVGPNNSGFNATYNVVAYTFPIFQLIAWAQRIPILGILVALVVAVLAIYEAYLAIVGIRVVHNTTIEKAAGAVLISYVIVLVLSCIILTLGVGAAIGLNLMTRP